MNNRVLLLVFLFAPASVGSAVDLTLDYSFVEATAAFGHDQNSNSRTGDLPGSTSVTGYQTNNDSYAKAVLNYNATNTPSAASFDFDVDLHGTHVAEFDNSTAQVNVMFTLTLDEPLAYSITGNLVCTADVPTDVLGVEFYGNWVFFSEQGTYYYQKEKWAFESAVLVADDVPDPFGPFWPTNTTGILPASTYNFLFIAKLDTTNALDSTAYITGHTNLTFTRLVPEPHSCVSAIIMLGITLYYRPSPRFLAAL